MNIRHKLALLIAIAISAWATTTTTASAQNVLFFNEVAGSPCNPCAVHITGESHITAFPAGVIVSRCQDEFSLHIYWTGLGEIEWTGTTDAAPGCAVVNCTDTNESHWPVSNVIEQGAGWSQAAVRICLRAGTATLHCDAVFSIFDIGFHTYDLTLTAQCAGGARRVEGLWRTEDFQGMEMVHLD